MPHCSARLLVTGASGKLGRLVIDRLLSSAPPAQVIAMVRNPEAGRALEQRGVAVRIADYTKPETLDGAFAGIDRILFISSNAREHRVAQHRHVIEAAMRNNVQLVAYTSVLHADVSPLGLARDHRETEAILRASGVGFVLLRNGWYTENYTAAIQAALAQGALLGCSQAGQIASASRADYAAAAAAVLASDEDFSGRVFELAGDNAYTLTDFAREITKQTGRSIAYVNVTESEYKAKLLTAGWPEAVAALVADSDAAAAKGALFDDGRQLRALIKRPTTTMQASVAEALAQK
jgi:NAD(P)H dehydrogenase (quinone)